MAEGPWRVTREPAINLPRSVAGLLACLAVAHVLRVATGTTAEAFALTPADLAAGRYGGLVTHVFVHADWIHLSMNALFIAAFGAPVARYLGSGWRGGAVLWAFFLVCGILSGGLFAQIITLAPILGPGPGGWALLGASGAASGLMGAAARLIDGGGRPLPRVGRTVAGMTISWILVNVILGLSGLTPGTSGAPVAWQAHILGYFAGLALVGVAGRLAGQGGDHVNES